MSIDSWNIGLSENRWFEIFVKFQSENVDPKLRK